MNKNSFLASEVITEILFKATGTTVYQIYSGSDIELRISRFRRKNQ